MYPPRPVYPIPSTGYPIPVPTPGNPNPAQDKSVLVAELKRLGIFVIILALDQNKNFITQSKLTVSNLQKIEKIINDDESSIATKTLRLQEKQQEVMKAISELQTYKAKLQEELTKSASITVTEDNVTEFVKPATELQEIWLKQESKRKSRDNCIQLLRKLYEDKSISLNVFLECTERMASREFKCIYKKSKIEGLIRREERAQP